MTVQEKTTRVNGMKIFYREAGAGEPILLLHGVPTSSYLWRHLMPRLAHFGRAVAPDHYGFGKSDKPPDADYSVPGYVRYLEGFTAALGVERLHLIVHDFGGPFGLALATAHPNRIRSLVLMNTIFYSDYEWHPLAKIWRTPGDGEELMAKWTRERFANGMLKWLAQPEKLTPADLDAYYESIADPAMRAAILALYRNTNPSDHPEWEERLRGLHVPALIIWGRRDPFLGADWAERFHRDLQGSSLHILDDAGHFVQEDQPENVAQLIEEFYARRPWET
ncbi:MAG: alpha/beta fold hydrolase [Candidatus Rokubacteria bacterium]|nr:alpha/beta fold hydrolase [Candidatus Rokubacteria bacterium]